VKIVPKLVQVLFVSNGNDMFDAADGAVAVEVNDLLLLSHNLSFVL
jgi:hypothetical protein